MLNISATLRTVRIAVNYKENTTKDGGKFASMYYSCASQRGTKKSDDKTDNTDFILVKFTGKLADVMHKYASAVNDGKLVSRHIYVAGHIETYQAERPVEFDTQIDGEEYTVKSSIKETRFVLVAEHVEFLDSAKKTEGKTAPTVTVTMTKKKPTAEKPAEAFTETTEEEEVPQVEADAIPEPFAE